MGVIFPFLKRRKVCACGTSSSELSLFLLFSARPRPVFRFSAVSTRVDTLLCQNKSQAATFRRCTAGALRHRLRYVHRIGSLACFCAGGEPQPKDRAFLCARSEKFQCVQNVWKCHPDLDLTEIFSVFAIQFFSLRASDSGGTRREGSRMHHTFTLWSF